MSVWDFEPTTIVLHAIELSHSTTEAAVISEFLGIILVTEAGREKEQKIRTSDRVCSRKKRKKGDRGSIIIDSSAIERQAHTGHVRDIYSMMQNPDTGWFLQLKSNANEN